MNKNKLILVKTIMFFIVSYLMLNSSSIFAQEKKDMPMHDMKNMKGMIHEKVMSADSSIIRKGIIDLKAIDKNKDGKVYQD